MFLQRTIREPIKVEGIGLHTGKKVGLTFRPAPANAGVHFVRADLPHKPTLAVHVKNITATSQATTLGGPDFSVATVEHCLAALAVLRIDNLIIELMGEEIPIGDGSAWVFWNALKNVGLIEQEQPRKYLYITKTIYLGNEERHAYIMPYNGLRVTCTIDFPHPRIRTQYIDLDINQNSFETQLSRARTFGFLKDVEYLQSRGLALGGSLDNAIVLDDMNIINPGGLHYPDEFVRHKAMDALGDIVTLGQPLMGHLVLYKAGHDLMSRFVKKVLETTDSYVMKELGTDLVVDDDGRSAWASKSNSELGSYTD
ncbi:MAG: UDP-3-O-acyl-N-acetylglucosamine deacetylase [Bdellovibrionales bacterium]